MNISESLKNHSTLDCILSNGMQNDAKVSLRFHGALPRSMLWQGAAWCPMGSDEQVEVSMSMGLAEASEVLVATPGGHTWWPPPPIPLISDVEGSQIKIIKDVVE